MSEHPPPHPPLLPHGPYQSAPPPPSPPAWQHAPYPSPRPMMYPVAPSGANPWMVGGLAALVGLLVGAVAGFFGGVGMLAVIGLQWMDTEPPPVSTEDTSSYYTVVELAFGESHSWADFGRITIAQPRPVQADPKYVDRHSPELDEYVALDVMVVNEGAEIIHLADDLFIHVMSGDQYVAPYWSPDYPGQPGITLYPGKAHSFEVVFGRVSGAAFVVEAETSMHWELATYS